MTTDAFLIAELRVHRLYGIQHDGVQAQELSRAVNVIYGPNARGKTTFGRAVQGMIWPEYLAPWRPLVSGSFEYKDAAWTVDLEEGRLRYQREGVDSQPSALPAIDHRERYWLSLHELLERDGGDFAAQIRNLALGGQNVDAAATELSFAAASGRGNRAPTKRVDAATKNLGDVQRAQQELRRRETGLADLERRRDEAAAAARRAALIRRAIELSRARRTAEQARLALEALPPILASVREDDADQVRQHLEDERKALASRGAAETRLADAHRDEEQNLIAAAGRPESPLADLRDRQRGLAEGERGLADAKQKIAETEAEVKDAWRTIAPDDQRDEASEPGFGEVRGEVLSTIDDLVADREALRQRQEARKALLRALENDDAAEVAHEHERVTEGIRTLGDWLRQARAADEQPGYLVPLTAISAAAFLVIGALAVVLWHPAGALAIAAAALLALLAVMMRRARPADPTAVQDRFTSLGHEPPQEWSIDAVSLCQRGMETECARLALRLEKARQREAMAPRQVDLDLEQAALDARAAKIAQQLGLHAPLEGSRLVTFAHGLVAWQKARREHAALLAKREEAWHQIQDVRSRFNEKIAPFDIPQITDASGAQGACDRLQKAYEELAEIDRQIEDASREIRTAEEAASRARRGIREVCERLKIDEDDAGHEAKGLCEQLPEYKKRERASGEAAAVAQRLREEVEADPACEPALLEDDEVALEQRLSASQEKAAQQNELAEEIGAIRKDVARAQQEHNLELALAEEDDALEALRRDFEEACAQSIGKLLADHVEEVSRETQLPPVFHRAKELFAAFTRSSYELRFDPREARFTGFDTVRERGCPLDELSSGTRVQLLLAVRIAFVELLEQGCKLPILLDETLANSDDERAEAIIDAVLTLCREGRQVFYFTAQNDEVLKWKRVARRYPDVECAFISLPANGKAPPIDEAALPPETFVGALPLLASHSREAYGKLLAVPRWTGWDDVAALHTWYLEPRLTALYTLLSKGFERWGHLLALQRSGAIAASGYDEATIAPLAVKAEALEAWQEAWRIGRGRRVDREALETCDAVTASFIDRIHERCVQVGGDGATLIRSLHEDPIARFVSQRDGLEEHLLAEGYIDDADPVSPGDIRAHVISQIFDRLAPAGLTVENVDEFFADIHRGAYPLNGT